jgi:hypothetical protein
MAEVQRSEVIQTTSNLPAYAQPYFENLMNRAQAASYDKLQPYPFQRSADIGFTPAQQQIQQNIMGLQAPKQTAVGSGLATSAGLGSLAMADYRPGQFNVGALGDLGNFRDANAERIQAESMQAARTGYDPNLTAFQMRAPDQFGQQQINQYMTPYMQNVVDIQKREAIEDARQAQIVQDLGAARQGTYGGSRQLLAGLERERNLGQQIGDIQARGLQSGYEQAAQQFERDRASGMMAGQQNLAAQLGVQELGTNVGLQTALANLTADQQARVQNMTAENQARGMNAENALRAALSNQQADIGVRGQNLQGAMQNQQLGLEAQRFGEQSRQFGAQTGLAALGQAGQMGQTLGNLGQLQQNMDAQRLGMQAATAGEYRTLAQQQADQKYNDFLRQRDEPMERLGYFSNILRGLPVSLASTQTTYGQAPSALGQVAGAGIGALGAYNMFKGP